MKNRIIELFTENNINLNNEQVEKFEKYTFLLKEWNNKFNLTSILEDDEIIIKHFIDSVLPYQHIKDNCKIIDIGAGAGFPSIPLKIMNNTLELTLIDSVNKKVDFLNTLINELNLNNCKALHYRCEDLAKKPEFRENFDISVARGVAGLNTLLEYTIPFIKTNGKLLLYKGSNYQEEINLSKNAITLLKCNISNIFNYTLKPINAERFILEIKKLDKTPIKYPRNQNKPRTNPL